MATIDDVYAELTHSSHGLAALRNYMDTLGADSLGVKVAQAQAALNQSIGSSPAAYILDMHTALITSADDNSIRQQLNPDNPAGIRTQIGRVQNWFLDLAGAWSAVDPDEFDPGSWFVRVYNSVYKTWTSS